MFGLFRGRFAIGMAFILTASPAFVFAEDSTATSEPASLADKQFQEAMAAADDLLKKSVEKAIREATDSGDFDALAALAKQGKGFTEKREIPTAPALKPAVDAWLASRDKAIAALIEVYDAEIRTLTMMRKFTEATTLQNRKQLIQKTGSLPDATTPIVPSDTTFDRPKELVEQNAALAQRVAEAMAEVREAVKRTEESAISRGDLDGVKSAQNALSQLEQNNFPQSPDAALKRIIDKHQKLIEKESTKRSREYDAAIARLVKEERFDEASELTVEALTADLAAHSRWRVVFRGNDAATWKSTSSLWNNFARPLEDLPQTVKYLRLRRVDTNDSVIIPITAAEIGKRFDQGVIGWGGDAPKSADVHHLGIFRKDVRPNERGYVIIGRDGFTGYTGWGLGHNHNDDKGIAFVWNGREIPATLIEVAVTSDDLEIAERKSLLTK
ncbi:MAG: hypothetical protein R3C01_13925 [Planctomycetaceae bacterium]